MVVNIYDTANDMSRQLVETQEYQGLKKALDELKADSEAFASFNGADFYGLPRNTGSVTLNRQTWAAPESYPYGEAIIKPLAAGETLNWRLIA